MTNTNSSNFVREVCPEKISRFEKKCKIYSRSFYEDLYSFDIQITSTTGDIIYRKGSSSITGTIVDNINLNTCCSPNPSPTDYWQPAIISNESLVYNKPIIGKIPIKNSILGIEDAITFTPEFNNWTISGNDSTNSPKMVCNWWISNMAGGCDPEYGVLFWYKKNSLASSLSGLNIEFKELPNGMSCWSNQSITIGSTTIPSGSIITKVSDTQIMATGNKSSPIDISNVYLDASLNLSAEDITLANQACKIWISDGECFSYFNNKNEKARYNLSNIGSRTYLSPGLLPIYRAIFHSLTKRRNKGTRYSRKQASALQKLCYFLSTAPGMDRTTTDILDTQQIYDIVDAYIGSNNFSDIDTEKTNLLSTIGSIMQKFEQMSLSIAHSSYNNNLVSSKKDLIKKILNKYGAFIKVPANQSIRLSKKASIQTDNHALFSIGYINNYPKNTLSSTTLYNNLSMTVGNVTLKTDLSDTKSELKILGNAKEVRIPITDIALPQITTSTIDLGGIKRYTWSPGTLVGDGIANQSNEEMAIKLDGVTGPELASSSSWELYSGSNCIRFSDVSKDRFRFQRFQSSTETDPYAYLKGPGEYELKFTQTSFRNLTQSDTLILYDASTDIQDNPTPDTSSTTLNKVVCSALKTIAVNNKGLLWIIDSDHYYYDSLTNEFDDYGDYGVLRLQDVKLNIQPVDKLDISSIRDDVLEFDLVGGNAGMWVISMDIEHMRDNSDKYKNCKSFYREKIVRKPSKNSNSPVLGASDFSRESVGSYRFDPKPENVGVSSVIFGDPPVSTHFSPATYTYGGYNEQMVDKLGIRIPGHNAPSGSCRNELPVLHTRNDVLNPTGIYCFPEEIPYSGTHYMTFTAGHFDPNKGWTSTNIGKTAVISDDPSKQECLTFKGGGFFNMRPTGVYSSSIYIGSRTKDIDNSSKYGIGGMGLDSTDNKNRNFYRVAETSWNTDTSIDPYNSNNTCGNQYTVYFADSSLSKLSSKQIKNIEVKLNFLNYFNPKNLRIWLELPGTTITGIRNTNLINKASGLPGISNYTADLSSQNFGLNRVMLFNQEYIDNYTNNYVVTFSDYADKFKTFYKYSSDTGNIVYHQKLASNYDKIMPTCKLDNKNDRDVEKLEFQMKNNKDNSVGTATYRLDSIQDINLIGSKFTLKIQLLDYLFNDGNILDNLLYNNEMSGLTSTEKYESSNTFLNSLCNWELIVYLKDIKNPISYKYTNSIDYSLVNSESYTPYDSGNSPSGYRYDYKCDFRGYEYLIPHVNRNAPYDYLANINSCYYDDPAIAKSIIAPKLEFPSLLPYYMATAGFAFGTILGGLSAIYALNGALSNGGRNDPIINYIIEAKLLEQTQQINGNYYKLIYDKEYFGQADRAVIAVSQDGAYWYGLEVPIFRYKNTPAVLKNKYKYIKIEQDKLGILSNIPYENINQGNIESIKLSFPNDFGQYNIGYGPIDTGLLPSGKYIITNNDRVSEFFASGENVYVSPLRKNVAINNIVTVPMSGGGKKTIIELAENVETAGYISKASGQCDTILIYKPNTTVIDNSLYFGKWNTEKTFSEMSISRDPEKSHSAYSPGSIGWGTSVIDPDIMYKMSNDTDNISTRNIIDNKNNDKKITNTITIYDASGNVTNAAQTISNIYGYSTTLNDISYDLAMNSIYTSGVSGVFYHTIEDKSSPIFMELKSDIFKNIASSGEIFIENDFVKNNKIRVTTAESGYLQSAIDRLKTDLQTAVTAYSSAADDPIDCDSPSSYRPEICPKASGYRTIKSINSQIIPLSIAMDSITTDDTGYYSGTVDSSGKITIAPEDSVYWISIDPNQNSILLDELTVKIPTKLEIKAEPIAGDFVGDSQIFFVKTIGDDNSDRKVSGFNTSITYSNTPSGIQREKDRLTTEYGVTWPGPSGDETIFYGGLDTGRGDTKKLVFSVPTRADNVAAFKETYIRPSGTSAKNNKKIKDVITLGSDIKVKFRNMPRQIRGMDAIRYEKYSYGKRGNIIKGASISNVDKLSNNFVCWKCIDGNGNFISNPTPFIKNMNEMIYRSFFGSYDMIEHKSDLMDSQEAWEWIPYEYFKKCDQEAKIIRVERSDFEDVSAFAQAGMGNRGTIWASIGEGNYAGIAKIVGDKIVFMSSSTRYIITIPDPNYTPEPGECEQIGAYCPDLSIYIKSTPNSNGFYYRGCIDYRASIGDAGGIYINNAYRWCRLHSILSPGMPGWKVDRADGYIIGGIDCDDNPAQLSSYDPRVVAPDIIGGYALVDGEPNRSDIYDNNMWIYKRWKFKYNRNKLKYTQFDGERAHIGQSISFYQASLPSFSLGQCFFEVLSNLTYDLRDDPSVAIYEDIDFRTTVGGDNHRKYLFTCGDPSSPDTGYGVIIKWDRVGPFDNRGDATWVTVEKEEYWLPKDFIYEKPTESARLTGYNLEDIKGEYKIESRDTVNYVIKIITDPPCKYDQCSTSPKPKDLLNDISGTCDAGTACSGTFTVDIPADSRNATIYLYARRNDPAASGGILNLTSKIDNISCSRMP